jgi:hypothetical protein
MAAERVTRQGVEVLGGSEGEARVSRQILEVLHKGDSKARASRQILEVLRNGDSNARVTRQLVEVLQNIPPMRATRTYVSVLGGPPSYMRTTRVYVSALGAPENMPRVAQQFIDVLGQYPQEPGPRIAQQYIEVLASPIGSAVIEMAADDTLSFGEGIDVELGVAQATDTLSLSDVAEGSRVQSAAVSDSLSLSDVAVGAFIHTSLSMDTLALDDAALRESVKLVVSTLSLSDEAIVERINCLSDSLFLSDAADLDAIYTRALVDALGLSDEADIDLAKRCRGLDSLAGIADTAAFEVIKPVHDTLALDDRAVVDRIYTTDDTLPLTDVASLQVVYDRTVLDTLVLSDAAEEVIYRGQDALSITDVADADWVLRKRAYDVLTLSDAGEGIRRKTGIAGDTLSLTDTAGYVYGAVDDLSLSDTAAAVQTLVGLDTLSLSDIASAVTNRVGATSSLVDLADEAGCEGIYNRHTGDSLLRLSDTATVVGPRYVAAEDDLQEVYQEYDSGTGEFYDYLLGLQDSATVVVLRDEPLPATDSLSLGERTVGIRIRADALPGVAEDALTLTDTAWSSLTPEGVDALTLTETAAPVLSKLFRDSLNLCDAATYQIVRVLVVADTLALGEAVAWYNPYANVEWVYHPFVGGGTGGPTPPPGELVGVELPVPGITDSFKLVHPPVGPFTDTLVLRAPKFGNRDRLQMNRISRETRGGTLIVFADPIWPKIQALSVQFEGLTWDEASGLLEFMEDHLGQEIGLLDWEHRYWVGVVVSTTDPVVHDGKHGYSASFEFEGELSAYSP